MSLVFLTLDLSGQPPIYIPLKVLHQPSSSVEECSFGLIAAGISQSFTSGIVKEFYETRNQWYRLSLSCSNGALAGLPTILFFKAGRPKDRYVKISSPRVPVRFLL